MSGAHAELHPDGILDLASSNGTYLYLINGNVDHSTQSATFERDSKDLKVLVGSVRIIVNEVV